MDGCLHFSEVYNNVKLVSHSEINIYLFLSRKKKTGERGHRLRDLKCFYFSDHGNFFGQTWYRDNNWLVRSTNDR